ncbi:MAG: YggT family protein [Syntrophales bacterium]|nr:YggT family protein [Syntrophales bacterium]
MIAMKNLLLAFSKVLDIVFTLFMWIIIFRAVISWVNPDPYNPFVQFLYRTTEPVLGPIRRVMPFRGTGIDLSPLVAILLIYFLQTFLVRTLTQLALDGM